MMQKRRINRLRRTLNLEALEDRMLLSGVVAAGEDPSTGILHIAGDGANNAITIKLINPDTIRISGSVTFPAPPLRPDITSVDGVMFYDCSLSSLSSVDIEMLNGNNQVTMSGFSVPGNITINAGSGHNLFTLDSMQTNSGSINITATGLGADTITLNNIVAGAANISAGAGADKISVNNVAIGAVNITTGNGTANDSITVSNSLGDSLRPGIGLLTIQSGNNNNTIGVTNTTLQSAAVSAGNGNNTISLDGSTMVSARIMAGTGSNSIDVSNDTFQGFLTALNLNVGVGGSAAQTVQLNNDAFSGGAVNVAVGDGSVVPASSFTMSNDTGMGTAKITLGKFFENVAVTGDVNALILGIGDNADVIHVNTQVAQDETITVGNAFTDPKSPLPAASLTIDGLVGTSGYAQNLQVKVGDGWSITVNATVTGNENVQAGNAATVTVDSPSIGGDLTITTGNDAPSITVTGTMCNNLTIQSGTGSTYFYLNNNTINNDLTLTGGDGDSALALLNLNILFSLSVTLGTGTHVFAAQNSTCLFGMVDGGPGSSNTYEDLGGNLGFFILGITGYVGGPFPPELHDSDLSLSTSTINQGDTATLTGTFSQLGYADTHTVTIDWGDGSESTVLQLDTGVNSFSATHQYFDDNADGTLAAVDKIAVTVTNSIGDSATAHTQITVNDVPPVLTPDGLQLSATTINEGDTASLTGTFTNPGQDAHQVIVNWGDGSTRTTLQLDAGVLTFGPLSHTYLESLPGSAPYTIQATVTDEGGASSTASTQVTVQNVVPSAINLGLTSAIINEGDTATLNGSFTDPGVLDTHTVVINWGDGSANTTLNLTAGTANFSAGHQYQQSLPGNAPYTIQVTVSDEDNASGSASTQVTVNDVPPANLNLGLTSSVINEGDTAALNGTFTDVGVLDTHTVVINWGDGSANTTLNLGAGVFQFSANHPYPQSLPGDAPYTIQVTVSDENNASSSASSQLTVKNVPPANLNLGFASAAINEGDTATLNGTFTDPGSLDTHTVVINWGDGSANTTLNLDTGVLQFNTNHQYLQSLPGDAPYTVQVTVSDEDNASTSASTPLTVKNVAPTNIQLGLANPIVNEGDTATLNGTFTDPGSLDTHTVVINWGDGSTATTLNLGAGVQNFSANHPYVDELPGNAPYTIQVTVSDEDNARGSASTQVIVNNVAPANIQLGFANATVNVGDTATLNGTFTDPGVLDTHTVVINWGDGSLNTTLSLGANVLNFTANHQYLTNLANDAPYTVQATVSDDQKASGSGSAPIIVKNVLPSDLQLSLASNSLNEGETATLNGTFTDPGMQNTHTVVINWGDGSATTTLNLGAGVVDFHADHAYEDVLPGDAPFTIQVTVSNQDNASISADAPVTVHNVTPADIQLSFDNATINEGDTATLNGTFTDPAILDTHSVLINWGDGSSSTNLNLGAGVLSFSARHASLNNLPGNAPYNVQVTISDEDQATASASINLVVNHVPPVVNAGPDQTVAEGTPVTLMGTFTDAGTQDGDTFQWTVVSSNGQVIPAGNGPSFTFTPKDDGQYTATFTVTDSEGSVGTSKVTVTATRVPPSVMISGAANVNEGSPYTLNLSGREPGADTITGWTITWGDGTVQTLTGNPSSATHVYADDANSYTIRAQANDEDGTTDAANTVAVKVLVVPPTLTLSGAAAANPSSPYTLNLSSSEVGSDTITSWTINWGDGTIQPISGNPSSVTHTYPLVHRTYTISAQATDEEGTYPAGNTVTVNMTFGTANENFVAQVYVDVLERPADLGGLQFWTAQLAAGASRAQVVQAFVSCQEYRTLVVEQLYHDYLGRQADATGLQNDLLALAAGTTTDQLKEAILASDEYNQRAGGTSNGFVSALYHDVLGRAGTPSEIEGWVQALAAGTSRATVASLFVGSTEANQLLVQNFYHKYLHRAADPDGLNNFVQARLQGATEEAVIVAMVASDEFFQQATR